MKHRFITKHGYILDRKQITKEQEKKILKDLTIKPPVLEPYKKIIQVKPYKLFLYNEQYLYLPKYYAIKEFGDPLKIDLPIPKKINFKMHFEPLKSQENIMKVIIETFDIKHMDNNHGGNSLICNIPCGGGKTYLSIKAASLLGLKTLVIVPKLILIDQWTEEITKFSTASVSKINSDTINLDGDITVCILHSICLKDFPYEMFDDYGLIILDEVHHLASEMFVKCLMKIRPRFILGLSATLERKDGLSHVFHNFIGNNIYSEKRTINNNVIIKTIKIESKTIEYETIYNSLNIKDTVKMMNNLSISKLRNKLIIQVLKYLIKEGRTILLISARRQHLEDLYDLLTEEKLKYNEKEITFGLYYGKNSSMTTKNHKLMLDESAKCDILLGSKNIVEEGFSVASLNTLVFATPAGSNVEQATGRILRKIHDINPTVIDIVDICGNFEKQYKERKKYYQSENYEILNIELKLENYNEHDILNFINNNISNYIIKKKINKKKKELNNIEEQNIFNECLLDEKNTINIKKINNKNPKINKLKNELKKLELVEKNKEFNIFENCLL